MTYASYGVTPVINKLERRYLLIQHNAGHWSFPKGGKEGNESDQETALRELREEVGINQCELIPDKAFTETFSWKKDRNLLYWDCSESGSNYSTKRNS
jgi:bis(5'-nucleosidyl)-tetraphosphatase